MKKFLLTFVVLLYSLPTNALPYTFPDYSDDEEAVFCMKKISDTKICPTEHAQRRYAQVKSLYVDLLTEPELLGWQGSAQKNKEVLKDMHESWVAYRNRLCSLSKVCATYTVPLFDEYAVCSVFQNINHYDYLNQILYTLNLKKRNNKYPQRIVGLEGIFNYLEFNHDEDYKKCMEKTKKTQQCLKEEIDRSTQAIKNYLNSFYVNEDTAKWNNGPDVKTGNLRDMFDSWVAFRNRMCSLTYYAQRKAYGMKAISFDTCIQFYNINFEQNLNNLLGAANSYLDEEMIAHIKTDGGEKEGKSIKPLNRRISSSISGDDNESSIDTEKDIDEVKPKNVINKKINQPARPAWVNKRKK